MNTQSPRRHIRPWLTFLAGACAFAVALPSRGGETDHKLVMMHYMPWYETAAVSGQWGGHWTGFDRSHDPDRHTPEGLPDVWSRFHPLIGPYDSSDPALLDCHLAQLKLAGVDGVVVDWYGVAEANDYPSIHRATTAVFNAAGGYGLSFAVCYEDRIVGAMMESGLLPADQTAARVAEDLRWLADHWFVNPGYATLAGKPLLLNFGPITVTDAIVWHDAIAPLQNPPALFALHHLWKKAGADGGFTWIHWNPWEGNPDQAEVRRRLREVFALPSSDPAEVIVSAWPGYHDVYPDARPTLDHRGGETLRVSLDEALASPARVVQLVTWNDYGEGTMIEPTHEFGYEFLEIVQAANRRRLGDEFPYSAADLRLPTRLYAARKAAAATPAELDAVADLIRRGDCREASASLNRLGL